MALTIETIKSELQKYSIDADARLCGLISTYVDLLLRWNSKTSLTAISEPIEIVRFHFGESLFAASKIPIRNGRLADVGSGAGFPGLPLQMLLPDLSSFLIEPNVKKATFLREVCRKLNLNRAQVLRFRVEDLPLSCGDFDFVTSRAVGDHGALLRWAKSRLSLNGSVVLWLGEERAASVSRMPDWVWKVAIKIPLTQHRVILSGSPVGSQSDCST